MPFLFDLDGTLADTLPDIAASTNYVRGEHGLPPLGDGAVRDFVGDGARALLQRALAEVLPGEPAARERFVDSAFATYIGHHDRQCLVSTRLFPRVREHLQRLHKRGHALAVVTNKPERFARPLLQQLGLGDLLSAIVGGDTLAKKKPDPAPLRHALRALGFDPGPGHAQGLGTMVGDGVQDLRAGKALGLSTIACLYGYGDPATLRREGADRYWCAFGVEP
jgi:phosphoglycolate phosphatase